jgi:serine/threonine protein kinase
MYMPYCGCPLNEVKRPELATYIISRLCEILVAFEENGVQHTDLKPNNILYNVATNEVTLIDYNIVSITVVASGTKRVLTPAYGTWSYSSPEVVFYTRPSPTSPTWAVGLLLAYLYARYPWQPIYKMTSEQVSSRTQWKKELTNLREKHPDCFPLSTEHLRVMPPHIVNLFRKCTRWNPQARPSLKEVYYDLIGHEMIADIPRILHSPPDLKTMNDTTRFIVVSKLYNTCRITKTLHLYLRAVSIFDRSYNESSPFTLYEHGCASFFLAVMLMGNNAFDMDFVDTILPFWQLESADKSVPILKDVLWYIGNACEWSLFDKTADVLIIENNPGVQVNYDELKTVLLQSPANSETIFKDIIAKQKVNVSFD